MPIRCDVCIVTDLRFPGGNASSTLDEIDTFARAGLRVRVLHCPADVSRGKPVSERYQRVQALCLPDDGFDTVQAEFMLVRNASVVCGEAFPALADRLQARIAVFIVNNSRWRSSGDAAHDLREFADRVRSFDCSFRHVFPIGPLIRAELVAGLPPKIKRCLGPFDWTPTFDLLQFRFAPRPELRAPFRIGRHGRDAREKWLQDPLRLAQAFPADADFRVHILGGADGALEVLGALPPNWTVLPFGSAPAADYLAGLDVLVYFPHTELKEAFGRTVAEAIMAGVPCVLPAQLGEAFGDLAFICEPAQVADAVRRLARHDALRLQFLQHARDVAAASFSSSVLFTRLERLDAAASLGRLPFAETRAAAAPALQRYKRWVETGDDEPRPEQDAPSVPACSAG
jgi:glycosyltransferase involved in cell wall biosynthesis